MQIITAWQHISPDVDVKGFKKCCISNAVDKIGGGMLQNGSEEVGNVRSQCMENEGTNCEDGDSDTDWFMYIESHML